MFNHLTKETIMQLCKYVDKGGRCIRFTTVHPDKSKPSKVYRYIKPNHSPKEETVQAFYPTYNDDYCYWHGKVAEGLIDGKNRG
jgi:hypothetical protein